MEWAYSLHPTTAPLVKKYQIDATVAEIGVHLLIDTAGEAGLNRGTTTSAADMVGVNLDTATYVTAQQAALDAERKVSVIVDPSAVWRTRLSGGAAENTALALQAVTTATTDGLDVTTAAEWSNPTFDEGVAWGYDGANAGQVRKITAVSGTAATLTVAFESDHQVGDNFLRAPYWYNATTAVQLTTLLTQADASIAVATGAEFVVLDMILRDLSEEGRTSSFIFMLAQDHVYGSRPT